MDIAREITVKVTPKTSGSVSSGTLEIVTCLALSVC